MMLNKLSGKLAENVISEEEFIKMGYSRDSHGKLKN